MAADINNPIDARKAAQAEGAEATREAMDALQAEQQRRAAATRERVAAIREARGEAMSAAAPAIDPEEKARVAAESREERREMGVINQAYKDGSAEIFDEDGKKGLNKDERKAALTRAFDKNGDGLLDETEKKAQDSALADMDKKIAAEEKTAAKSSPHRGSHSRAHGRGEHREAGAGLGGFLRNMFGGFGGGDGHKGHPGDRDGDGIPDRMERGGRGNPRMGASFSMGHRGGADLNGDGVVSGRETRVAHMRQEKAAKTAMRAARETQKNKTVRAVLDADGDGKFTSADIEALAADTDAGKKLEALAKAGDKNFDGKIKSTGEMALAIKNSGLELDGDAKALATELGHKLIAAGLIGNLSGNTKGDVKPKTLAVVPPKADDSKSLS